MLLILFCCSPVVGLHVIIIPMASSHQSASASRHPDGHSRHDAVRSGTRTLKTKNKFPEFARAPFQDQLHCQTPIPCGTWEVEISSHTYHSSLDLAPYTAYEGQGTKPTALFPKTPLHPEFRRQMPARRMTNGSELRARSPRSSACLFQILLRLLDTLPASLKYRGHPSISIP